MIKKLERDALLADLSAVEKMLERIPESDILGRISFNARYEELKGKISALEERRSTLANVAVIFNGSPVTGARSIDAEFATNAINAFQEIVSKEVAQSESGGLSQVGRLPFKDASKLSISGVVHGSFGFVLEETDQDSPELINSSLKEAVDRVTSIVEDIADTSTDKFTRVIETIDPRKFAAIRRFYRVVYNGEASLRIVEDERELTLNPRDIERGYDRIENSKVSEEDVELVGELIGLAPVGRRFEFKPSNSTEVLRGKIGPLLSQAFIQRLSETEGEVQLGTTWNAVINKKVVNKPDGKVVTSYQLISLNEI